MTLTLWSLDHLAPRRFNTVFSCPEVSCGDKHPRCGAILVIQNIGIFVSGFIFFLYHFSEVFNSSFVFSTDFVALAGAGWGILH